MNLVNTKDFDIKGESYYWTRRERLQITEQELHAVGICNEHAYVDRDLILTLRAANSAFNAVGYEIFVKDGFRSRAAYKLARQKVAQEKGKALADKLFNMDDMVHSTGRAVDVTLLSLETGQEVMMRDGAEDTFGAWMIGYYLGSTVPAKMEYQRLQTLLIGTMVSAGFGLGTKREYWHFEYVLEH